MKIQNSLSPVKAELVGLEKNPAVAAFAVTISDDGNRRLVDIRRIPLPLWPRSRQARRAVELWSRWRLAEALEGGRT